MENKKDKNQNYKQDQKKWQIKGQGKWDMKDQEKGKKKGWFPSLFDSFDFSESKLNFYNNYSSRRDQFEDWEDYWYRDEYEDSHEYWYKDDNGDWYFYEEEDLKEGMKKDQNKEINRNNDTETNLSNPRYFRGLLDRIFYLKKEAKSISSDRIATFFLIDKDWFSKKEIKECLQVAGNSEFQFNMNCLVVKFTSKDKRFRLFISIPVSIYNYPQKVSSGSVDFNLEDVEKASFQVKEKDKLLANELKIKLNQIFKNFNSIFDIEYLYMLDGASIHRHPGRFGFSATDLQNDPSNPGVIFRKSKAKNTVQVDSVMVWERGEFDLYCSESRYLNLKPSKYKDKDWFQGNWIEVEKDGVKGVYCLNPTVAVYKKKPKFFYKYLSSNVSDYTIIGDQDLANTDIGKVIIQVLSSLKYEPVILVEPKNIEQKSYTYWDAQLGSEYTVRRSSDYGYYGWDIEERIYSDRYSNLNSNSNSNQPNNNATNLDKKEEEKKDIKKDNLKDNLKDK